MEELKILSTREIENLTPDQRKIYYQKLKEYCSQLDLKRFKNIGQKLISKIYPLLRNYDLEIIGEENIPQDDSAIFMCNHSNSHDIFTAYEVFEQLGRTASVMVASDCLSLAAETIFRISDATIIDRRDKASSLKGLLEHSKKIIEGTCGVVFGEATWNLNPYLPMQQIKIGGTNMGAITEKCIIPTILEYVEVPDIVTKESELYKKCVITFGKPIKIDPSLSPIAQTIIVQRAMEELRLESWQKNGIVRNGIEGINKEIYLNHTYIKKFKALGFTYDSESESKFLYSPNGEPVENEYTINENGEFVPGVTPKVRKR